jgi:hypothetical protein
MDTRSTVFVTIDKLVSPSSSVNGDPLDNFPDHWQPRFFFEFPLPRSSGADLARPLRTKRRACFRPLRQRRSCGRSSWQRYRFQPGEFPQPLSPGAWLLLYRFRGCKLPRSLLCPRS